MQSTLKQKQTDDPHDIVVVAPDAIRVAPADEELSSLLHEAAARFRSDTPAQAAPDVSGASVPPVDTTFRPSAVNDVLGSGRRRSIGRGALRAVTALLLTACIGGAAIAWQSSGTMAKQMIGRWAPQFVMTSLFPPEQPGLSAQPAAQADAANAASSQPASPVQAAAESAAPPAAVAAPADQAQSLQSLARDLASAAQEIEQLKASIEQLKASQQQMSRDVAKASEQNLRPRVAKQPAPPPRAVAAPVHQPYPPRQAVAAPPSPQAAAPYVSRQPEPLPRTAAEPPLADPELASVPRPPMPLR